MFFTSMFKESFGWKKLPHFAHGCRAGHSREEARLISMITSEKLKHVGYFHINVFHDMINAFLCAPHETLNQNATNICNVKDAHLLKQRHKEATIQLQCPERDTCLRLGDGGMVGDHGGLVSFMASFHPGVEKWEKGVA